MKLEFFVRDEGRRGIDPIRRLISLSLGIRYVCMERRKKKKKKKEGEGKEIRRIARCQRRTGERYRRLSGAVGRPVPKGAVCRLAGIVCEIPSIVFDESIEARRPRFRKSRYAGPRLVSRCSLARGRASLLSSGRGWQSLAPNLPSLPPLGS